jgi:hypothetical protein
LIKKKQPPGSEGPIFTAPRFEKSSKEGKKRERRGLNRGPRRRSKAHASIPGPSAVAVPVALLFVCGLNPAHTHSSSTRARASRPGHGSGSPQLLVGGGPGAEVSHSPPAYSRPYPGGRTVGSSLAQPPRVSTTSTRQQREPLSSLPFACEFTKWWSYIFFINPFAVAGVI